MAVAMFAGDVENLIDGDTYTIHDCQWVWVAADGIERGQWHACDSTGIVELPPSEGIATWMVIVPKGGREVLVEMERQETAFHYAAKERKARAN